MFSLPSFLFKSKNIKKYLKKIERKKEKMNFGTIKQSDVSQICATVSAIHYMMKYPAVLNAKAQTLFLQPDKIKYSEQDRILEYTVDNVTEKL